MKQYLNKEFLLSNKKLIIKAAAIAVMLAAAFLFLFWAETAAKKSWPFPNPRSRLLPVVRLGRRQKNRRRLWSMWAGL